MLVFLSSPFKGIRHPRPHGGKRFEYLEEIIKNKTHPQRLAHKRPGKVARRTICPCSHTIKLMRNIIKQIRKTSLVLFGHNNNGTRRRSISESFSQHPFPSELKTEIQQLKETIRNRDDEINKLKHEIHKLKVGDEPET